MLPSAAAIAFTPAPRPCPAETSSAGRFAYQVGSRAPEPDNHLAVDRAQAIRLVDKLQVLAADRAATEAERALARAKAEALSARFRLDAPLQESRRHVWRGYRAGRAWSASPEAVWTFDTSTGKGPKVNVRHDWQRGGWKISVEIGWRTGTSWSAFSSRGSRIRRW